ncbi:flippase [Methanobrevibacter sp. OttesenSCG-928-K11]|nr:flippase [Methanobrevibacter sp. OttesenSCG-928-K11]
MSQVKTSFLNMSWLMISQIIASICGFVWTILTARYLGVSDYGILAFAISVTGILAIVADFGISTHIVRKISSDFGLASKYLGNAFPLKSIFSIFSFLFILIILIILGYDEITITVTLLFTLEMIFKSMFNLCSGAFQAVEKGKYQSIGTTILNVILLIFIFIAVFIDLGIIGISLAYLFANIIAFIYSFLALRKNIIKPNFQLDKDFSINLTKLAIPFALTTLFTTIYYSIDVVMITSMVGDYAAGLYNASYKLISFLSLFYGIYNAVVFPVMSKFYKNEKSLLNVSLEKSIKYLLLITIPLAVLTTFYSKEIIVLFFGPSYILASSILQILIWTVCFLFINGACSIFLNASYKEVAVTKIYLIAAVFNVIVNLILIPFYSYNGAAIATVLSDVLIFILAFYTLSKIGYLPKKSLVYDVIKIIIASVILAIVLYLLNMSLFVGVAVGIIIYLIAVLILRTVDEDDKYIVKEILGKN